MLGEVLSEVTGTPVADLVIEQLITPLGLANLLLVDKPYPGTLDLC